MIRKVLKDRSPKKKRLLTPRADRKLGEVYTQNISRASQHNSVAGFS